jgi:hypothetical protein
MERVIKLDDVGVCVRIMKVVSCAITADDDVLWHHALPVASANRYRYFTAAMPGSTQEKRKLLTSGNWEATKPNSIPATKFYFRPAETESAPPSLSN